MQRLKLDINPTGEIPVLYVAQYDKGRSFEVELVDGEQAYNVPSGYSVQLNVRKTDSKLVTAAPTNVAENILTFATSEQMTACAGENIGSVTLKDADDIVITTLYFLISVQRDVLAGGLDSASEIHNLEQQIAAIVPEVIGENYYNKTETDALLADKADVSDLPDMTNYYTKTQTDTLLNGKANTSDLATLASKAELEHAIDEEDTAIKNWAYTNFATPGYIANRYYNKTQVDELLFNMLPIGTASGNPCSFDTEIEAVLHALTAEIVASGGGGTPSNPIPIVGHSELNLDVNGNTFTVAFGQTVYGGVLDVTRGKLTVTHKYDDLGTLTWLQDSAYGKYFYTTGFSDKASGLTNMICTEYANATGYGNQQPDLTIRGAETGNVHRLFIRNNSCADATEFNEIIQGVMLAYELATPFDIDLTPVQISAVVGTNNIISDCNGDVNVSYKDSIQHYIDSRI